ncbi:helix-turn-helix domain-containing protein [Haloplanus halophilus]|uniref:helix-turn-helix domain-containing protein n=1 Tax=Haloplanus halophilus TaxID=2949993 RepID=UPI002040FEA6|nr:helix-turn-helix domain-containing protein [Haloplanus sp. GDY1]
MTEASGTPDGWEFELLASETEDLREFQSACTESGVSITVRTIRRSDVPAETRDGLTDPQREILRLAHDAGYFGVPRETTVSELAAELDVSPQAASKRIRRAVEAVVDHTLRTTRSR